jgi:hypothetical protein
MVNRIKEILYAHTELGIPITEVYQGGAINVPGTPAPEPPFVVVRGLEWSVGVGVARQKAYWVFIHDAFGTSYAHRIEPTLHVLSLELPALAPHNADGVHVTACTWEGDSEDLIDDGAHTVTKYGQFRITGHP